MQGVAGSKDNGKGVVVCVRGMVSQVLELSEVVYEVENGELKFIYIERRE